MSETNVGERRAHERLSTNIAIEGKPDQGDVVARMVTRNLSLGGLYCTSTTDFPEMTRLAVRLMLPLSGDEAGAEADPVDLEAVVVRREKAPASNGGDRFDLALFFTNVDEATRSRLQTFIDRT